MNTNTISCSSRSIIDRRTTISTISIYCVTQNTTCTFNNVTRHSPQLFSLISWITRYKYFLSFPCTFTFIFYSEESSLTSICRRKLYCTKIILCLSTGAPVHRYTTFYSCIRTKRCCSIIISRIKNNFGWICMF